MVDKCAESTFLVHMMLRNREISKQKLTADYEDGRNRGCIHLYMCDQSYIDKTPDGKSYRLKQNVITMSSENDILCYYLIVSGVKHENKERHPREFVMDNQTLQIGKPTESFTSLAESCELRNETMPMLKNDRLSEDQNFQIRWLEAKERLDNT